MSKCRACLQQEADVYYSLSKKIEHITLEDIFNALTGLSVCREDKMPRYICQECLEMVVTFHKFRNVCLDSDAQLRLTMDTIFENCVANSDYDHQDLDQKSENITIEAEQNRIGVQENDSSLMLNSNNMEQKHTITKNIIIESMEPDTSHHVEYDDLEVELEEDEVLNDATNDNSTIEYMNDSDYDDDNEQTGDDTTVNDASDEPSQLFCCGCPGLYYYTSEELRQHTNEVHEKHRILNNLRPYECNICYKRYISSKWLTLHQAKPYRKRKYPCSKCEASFYGRSALLSHKKSVHLRERKYSCDVCQKSFYTSSLLISHRQIHSEKKFQCRTCEKMFLRQADLLTHEATHLEERPFGCTVCAKRFKSAAHLRNHRFVHTGERTRKCKYCGKGFLTYTDRRVHQLEHENIHPYKCKYCDKIYGRNYKLQLHIRKAHTGERPFGCALCSQKFYQHWELTAHRKTAHDEDANTNEMLDTEQVQVTLIDE